MSKKYTVGDTNDGYTVGQTNDGYTVGQTNDGYTVGQENSNPVIIDVEIPEDIGVSGGSEPRIKRKAVIIPEDKKLIVDYIRNPDNIPMEEKERAIKELYRPISEKNDDNFIELVALVMELNLNTRDTFMIGALLGKCKGRTNKLFKVMKLFYKIYGGE